MAQQINVNIRMDKEVKEQADNLFSELGFNLTTAVNAFVKQALRENAIPFQIKINVPNAETRAAMQEIEDMRNGRLEKNSMSVSDFLKEMERDE